MNPPAQTNLSPEERFEAAGVKPELAHEMPDFNGVGFGSVVPLWLSPTGKFYDAHCIQNKYPNHADSALAYILPPEYITPQNHEIIDAVTEAEKLGWVRVNISPRDQGIYIEYQKSQTRPQKSALRDLAFHQNMNVEDDDGRVIVSVNEAVMDRPAHYKSATYVALDGEKVIRRFDSLPAAMLWQTRHPQYTVMPVGDYSPNSGENDPDALPAVAYAEGLISEGRVEEAKRIARCADKLVEGLIQEKAKLTLSSPGVMWKSTNRHGPWWGSKKEKLKRTKL